MFDTVAQVAGALQHASGADVVPETAAEAFLMQLRRRGIENFYVNAGTDFAPLVEAYARLSAVAETLLPRPIVAAHENLAMGMAHGAYLVSGRPQAVMFHVGVGTANAACAALNAAAERVPLLIIAGRSPLFEGGVVGARNTRVAWAQEMFDQASLVREAVKWDYELRGAAQVDAVVDRALTLAMAQPRGPVYLTLPREVLAAPAAGPPAPGVAPSVASAPYPDPVAVEILAERMASARFPVISSLASGAEPDSLEALAHLCDRFSIGYAEEQARYLNFPSEHPMHLGHAMPPVLAEADVLCVLEGDVPWVSEFAEPNPATFVAQCGVDADFSRYPIRTHRRDLAISSTSSALIRALIKALEPRAALIDPARRDRLRSWASLVRSARDRRRSDALHGSGPITYDVMSAALSEVIHENCTLFNEYWVSPDFIERTRPGSYFYLPATGGLGWALPAAIGARKQAPDRTYIAAIGDGTYMFSNPAACHHASQKHGLPTLTIVCNNARWNAVDATSRLVYPAGAMTRIAKTGLSDLVPSPAFEHYVTASGGYGEAVSCRGELVGAFRRGLDAVEKERRQALINVICD